MLDTAEKAYELFKKELDLLPEGDAESKDPIEKAEGNTVAWANKCITGYETARKLTDSDEKKARLADAMVKEVSQLTFVLFRRNLLTKELEKQFRELPLFENTDYEVVKFVEKRDVEVERVLAERNKVQKEQRALDIFQAILTQGMTEEQAEKQMAAYEAKQKAALEG